MNESRIKAIEVLGLILIGLAALIWLLHMTGIVNFISILHGPDYFPSGVPYLVLLIIIVPGVLGFILSFYIPGNLKRKIWFE